MEQIIGVRLPNHFSEYFGEEIMSNFDGLIIEETAENIKDKPLYSRYAGWNFNGKVWYQAGQWHCEVWQYHIYMETVSANELREIMSEICSKYGYD